LKKAGYEYDKFGTAGLYKSPAALQAMLDNNGNAGYELLQMAAGYPALPNLFLAAAILFFLFCSRMHSRI
jgi:hypothetical protein